ncbi:DUF5914 domain-containing protein [Pseudonocardia sp. WMMC193]|uniref:DUF5914 domain-containing protein n=1 Tax=Pseudonocardia sp. WMMC193 TaxID=2911965 RepID=UPI001F3F300A|nr:DUF5914 domain-containing protein [Pseudonocardia sp. WMMC193]MCF7551114.1 Rieske (2Fe-2S) protein [Pseudonocardia sp. WMMC193]
MPKRPVNPLRLLDLPRWADQEPSWTQADPALIEAATERALARPAGGWVVVCGSREIAPTFGRTVAGREIVVWRTASGELRAGPGACPHLGAALCDAPVVGENLVCRWHGLPLGRDWGTYPVHDDGVLVWVRLDVLGEPPLDAPVLGPRPPAGGVPAVATVIGRCEPRDVLANRLDPWHGSWFHPYSFAQLRVLAAPRPGAAEPEDRFLVEVGFRVAGRLGVPVKAEFSCPDPRTVTMEIVDGEGTGSVVETHATPLGPGPDGAPRTAVIEAVVAYSDRPGFGHAAKVGAALRPLMRAAAARLWRDDIAYAERRYTLRSR